MVTAERSFSVVSGVVRVKECVKMEVVDIVIDL